MKIVTDSGADILLPAERMADLKYEMVPLKVTLDGVTYREGVDIQPQAFYEILERSKNLPITSQPSAGEFADVYRKLAEEDPEILSIHLSWL